MLEPLEERCLLNAGNITATALQLGGAVGGIVAEANELLHPPPGTVARNGWYAQHGGYLAGNLMNTVGFTLGLIPGADKVGKGFNIGADATQAVSALGRFGYLAKTQGFPATNSAVADEEAKDLIDGGSALTALSADITSLFNGQAPKIIADSLGIGRDGFNFITDALDKNWIAAGSDFVSVGGDVVGLISDLLGGDAATQPLQVSLLPGPVGEGSNFDGPIASFTDPNVNQPSPGNYSAVINWGDGTSSAGQIVSEPDSSEMYVWGSHTYNQTGTYPMSVLVTGDGTQGQDNSDKYIPPYLASASGGNGFTEAVGQPILNGQVASFQVNAFGSQEQGVYSATIDWGDGATSTGQIVYGGDASQDAAAMDAFFGVQGSHTYAQPGNYTIATQINAPNGESLSAATQALVLSPEQAIDVPSTPDNISAAVGQPFTGPVASFYDFDGQSHSAGDFQATIDWGDGVSTPAQIVAAGNGSFNVIGSHTYTQIGQYDMAVSISGDFSTEVLPTATVGPFNLTGQNVQVAAGQTYSGTLATLSGPASANGDYTAEIFWGDDASAGEDDSSWGQLVANGDGTFSIVGTHTYPGAGAYNIRLFVFGPNEVRLSADSTATVGSGALAVTAQNLTINPSPSANTAAAGVRTDTAAGGGSVNGTVAAFTAPAGASAGDYTATINWGDGNTSTGQIVANADGTFNVLGAHTYSQIEGYLTSVQVSDSNGNIASAFGTVSPPLPTSSINPLPATDTSPNFTVSWSGSDPNGPGIASYSVYVSDDGGVFNPWLTGTTQTSATFTGQAGHSYGFYSVATDTNGLQQPTPNAAQATTTVQMPGNNNPGNNNPGTNNPGTNNPGTNNPGNKPSWPQNPAPPDVPPLLAWINQVLGGIETVNANGTTITDSLFSFPLVETYSFAGNLVSVTLLGFNITFLF